MLKRILKTSPSATFLILGIILGLAIGYGLIVLGMIIAWLILGEGEASPLYHDSTLIVVLTFTLLILLGLSALIGKAGYKKGKLDRSSAMFIAGVSFVLVYLFLVIPLFVG